MVVPNLQAKTTIETSPHLVYAPPPSRPSVCASGIRLQRKSEGVPACPETPRHGLHLWCDQGAWGAAHLQRPPLLRLPGCQRDGIPCIKKGMFKKGKTVVSEKKTNGGIAWGWRNFLRGVLGWNFYNADLGPHWDVLVSSGKFIRLLGKDMQPQNEGWISWPGVKGLTFVDFLSCNFIHLVLA